MSLDMFKLDGKVAVVTGGSRGFGKAIALALADAGADIVVAARTKSALEEVAAEIQKKGRKALAVETDMLNKASINAMADKAFETFGKIDILINNAGQGDTCPFLKLSEEQWDTIININLKGYFLATQAVGKYMVKAKSGRIINISSAMGEAPLGFMSPYAASKGGINSMTKSLAQEWATLGITVNAIAPSYFDTDINKNSIADENISKMIMSKTPVKRWGKVDELTGIVIYLASGVSSYMTGTIIALDGGWTAG